MLVTLVSGIIAEKYGPRKIAGFGFIIGALLSAMIPMAAEHLWLLITIRVLLGISMASNFLRYFPIKILRSQLQGTIPPSLQAAILNWAPPDEIGKFQSVFMASGIGVVIDWCTSGLIIEHLGWVYAFYALAVVQGLFCIVWFSVVYDSPSNHPKISTAEKEFILSKLNTRVTNSKV